MLPEEIRGAAERLRHDRPGLAIRIAGVRRGCRHECDRPKHVAVIDDGHRPGRRARRGVRPDGRADRDRLPERPAAQHQARLRGRVPRGVRSDLRGACQHRSRRGPRDAPGSRRRRQRPARIAIVACPRDRPSGPVRHGRSSGSPDDDPESPNSTRCGGRWRGVSISSDRRPGTGVCRPRRSVGWLARADIDLVRSPGSGQNPSGNRDGARTARGESART